MCTGFHRRPDEERIGTLLIENIENIENILQNPGHIRARQRRHSEGPDACPIYSGRVNVCRRIQPIDPPWTLPFPSPPLSLQY